MISVSTFRAVAAMEGRVQTYSIWQSNNLYRKKDVGVI